ncbi:MAG: c-type cytochrome [Nitrospirae bacterium]|nr:c-type cytochrome [Nitrospirota bacterium]
MSNKAARNLFIFICIFFFAIFIALSADTLSQIDKRAPEITDEVNAGKMVWHKYDCIGCHTIFGTGSYFAPDLTKITDKKPKDYLKKFLMDPRGVNPRAAMPKLGINSTEADNLITFFQWVAKVDTNGWPPKPILATAAEVGGAALTPGQSLYQSLGCVNCHMLNGIGGTTGPELTHVASRHDRAWLQGHLKDPKAYVPGSAMPDFKQLSDQQANDLTDYMASLK